jgi:DNA-binding response OmpR family regulator
MNRILIIEDESDISESLAYMLHRHGFDVRIAETGEAGLRMALAENDRPALILLDVMLPGMSGLELCRRLRRESLTEKTPIIMLSAKASNADQTVGLEMGADLYICKPFSLKRIVAQIQAMLAVRQQAAAGS